MTANEKKQFDEHIGNEDRVNVYLYQDTVEIATLRQNASPIEIKKVDKEHYKRINHETGEEEVFEYSRKSTSRQENIPIVLRTMRELRRTINANDWTNQLWLTLTYAENQKDTKQVYKDFQIFMKDLRRKVDYKLDYINVVEPQERGAWHCHVLLRTDDSDFPYISNDLVAKCWKRGFTKTKRIKETDNIAAYLTAYLTCLFDDETKESIKGARLILYPKGVNIFRCSRGIKRPEKIKNVSKQSALDTFNKTSDDLTFSSNKEIELACEKIRHSIEIYT